MAKKRRGRGEGTIGYREDKGCWQGVITLGYDSRGKRRRRVVYGRTKKEVQDKMVRLQGRKLDGTLGDTCKLRLSEYFQQWMEHTARRTLRPATFDSYSDIVRLHIDPHIGGVKLSDLTPSHIDGVLARLSEAGLSPRRQQMVFAVLRRALNQAVKRGLVFRNICSAVESPKGEQREMHPLTQAEAKRFLEAAETDRLHALYVLAVTVGMRQGELFALEWEDVDLDARTLHVRRTLNESKGRFLVGPPKTKRGIRRIRLPQVAVEALHEHRKKMLAEGHAGMTRIFCDQRGGPLRRQNIQRRSFKKALASAECPDIRFHDLRHTYASLALAAGVPLKVVSETMGHSRASITLDIYAHVLPTQERLSADAMDAAFAS